MIEILKKRWVYHLLIWVAIFLTMFLLSYLGKSDSESLASCIMDPIYFLIPVIPVAYLSFWAKSSLFDQRKYLQYALAVVAIVIFGVIVFEQLDVIRQESTNPRSMNITNMIFIQLFAVGLQYFKRGIINQYQLQELKAKTVTTELNALKAQINPHFLFNTLNNIYGMNQIDPQKGSEMIMELSDVMRYHLEFSKEGKVKLEDEIQLLESYIKLELLRLRDTCDVKVDLSDVDEGIRLSPLLFIPFVENAFKHGTHPTKPCYVHIKLIAKNNKLLFTVNNSIIVDRKVVKTHVGLQNTKRRLELLFPEKHDLKITQTDNDHQVELSIVL